MGRIQGIFGRAHGEGMPTKATVGAPPSRAPSRSNTRHRAVRAAVAWGALAGSVIACQPRYDGLQVSKRSGYGEFKSGVFTLEEGQIMAIKVRPLSSNPREGYEEFDLVRLSSFDDSIMLAAPSAELDEFVLVGRAIGETGVRVFINDREESVIDARVVAQEVDR